MIIPAIVFDITHAVGVQCDQVLGQSIHEVILYGSYALGTPHIHSDLNIMLTLHCEPTELDEHFRKITPIISDLSLEHNITIRVELVTKEQFRLFSKIIPKYAEIAEKSFRYTRFGLNLPNWEEEE